MVKCPTCNLGGCKDFSSRAEQLPSLADIEVVRTLLTQALTNMCTRLRSVASGEMTREEAENKNRVLADWLTDTLSGCNRHFQSGAEGWNPEGLSEHLLSLFQGQENFPFDCTRPIGSICLQFVAQAEEVSAELVKRGAFTPGQKELPAWSEAFVENWCLLLTGAPI